MTSYQTIALDTDDEGICTLTLDRPENLNAFTVTMAHELEHAFSALNREDEVRAIILTGAGRAFCAGMDLTREGNVFGLDEDLRPTLEDVRSRMDAPEIADGVRDTGGRVTLAIYECSKPVIAAINGAAVGIGATMTLAADVRIASQDARIGFVFGRIGITPEACSTWFLPRLVGLAQALEWVYTAEILTPDEARRGGLLRDVVEPAALLESAQHLARRFVDHRSAVSTALSRQMLLRNSALPHPRAAHEVESLAVFYTSIGDGKEGVAAFLEKREPVFDSRASQMPEFFDAWTRE